MTDAALRRAMRNAENINDLVIEMLQRAAPDELLELEKEIHSLRLEKMGAQLRQKVEEILKKFNQEIVVSPCEIAWDFMFDRPPSPYLLHKVSKVEYGDVTDRFASVKFMCSKAKFMNFHDIILGVQSSSLPEDAFRGGLQKCTGCYRD